MKTFKIYVKKEIYLNALSEMILWNNDPYNYKWTKCEWNHDRDNYGWMTLEIENESTIFWIGIRIGIRRGQYLP